MYSSIRLEFLAQSSTQMLGGVSISHSWIDKVNHEFISAVLP